MTHKSQGVHCNLYPHTMIRNTGGLMATFTIADCSGHTVAEYLIPIEKSTLIAGYAVTIDLLNEEEEEMK